MSISTLSEVESDSLEYEVYDKEKKAALWSLKATKASEPNGLHEGFFFFPSDFG